MDLLVLEERIRVKFKDQRILLEAVTHRSYLNENRRHPVPHNERLEFLGDAVLEIAVTDYLFRNFRDGEGAMTFMRSFIVKSDTAAMVAEELGLKEFILCSRGQTKENRTNLRALKIILANAFEALVGAIYLDQGQQIANRFIDEFLLAKVEGTDLSQKKIDPKSRLQERIQKDRSITPVYRVIDESGPDHERKFVIGVYCNDELLAHGIGASKQEAEQDAAINALANL
jgi:ribonuclease-3